MPMDTAAMWAAGANKACLGGKLCCVVEVLQTKGLHWSPFVWSTSDFTVLEYAVFGLDKFCRGGST